MKKKYWIYGSIALVAIIASMILVSKYYQMPKEEVEKVLIKYSWSNTTNMISMLFLSKDGTGEIVSPTMSYDCEFTWYAIDGGFIINDTVNEPKGGYISADGRSLKLFGFFEGNRTFYAQQKKPGALKDD